MIGALGGLLVALLARVPALSRDGRQRAALKSDLELLKLMPPGPPRDAYAKIVLQEVEDVAAERASRQSVWITEGALLTALTVVAVATAWIPLIRLEFWGRLSEESQNVALTLLFTAGTFLVVRLYAGWLQVDARRRRRRRTRREVRAAR